LSQLAVFDGYYARKGGSPIKRDSASTPVPEVDVTQPTARKRVTQVKGESDL
jgi:hypothetical protein